MTLESVNKPRKYVKYAECSEGDVLVSGKYVGTTTNKFNPDRPNYVFESNGEEVVLNTTGQLRWLIEDKAALRLGQAAEVVYKGQETITTGPMAGKPAHKFDLRVDPTERWTQTEMTLETNDESILKELE